MISRRDLPSVWRFWVYSMVAWSWSMRTEAMRHRALLAWRFPPRLRRCRMVCPDDAWTGLVPHRAAKDDSVRMRSGLSPAVMSSAAAVSAPTPRAAKSAGLTRTQSRWMSVSRSSISAVSD